MRTSLAVQWLRLYVPNATGAGLTPGQGIRILRAAQHGQKKNTQKKQHMNLTSHL